MNSWLIVVILALYILMLFACAMFGEKYANTLHHKARLIIFSLTLGVYCSSWTFFGASGGLAQYGILSLAIYLGPLLFIAFGYDIWRRLGRVRQYHAISSIADFIAARYGKSGTLAAIVTVLAVIAIMPYLALQLRAISLSTDMIIQSNHLSQQSNYAVLFLTGILAVLAMIFGTRQIANTEQHGGLMLAVAFESFVKLFALIAIALFFILENPQNIHYIQQDVSTIFQQIQITGVPETFWIQTLLAALAMLCLPRQFHVAVVELGNEQQLRGARRWFSLYLILTILAVIPIASWALHYYPSHLNADIAILALPLSYQQDWLTILAFLGGFSASTGMLLVSSLALSIMLSNDLIMPTIWRFNLMSRQNPRLPILLKFIRQACILIVMLLGFLFFRLFDNVQQLSILGLLAFSAVAQFAPTLIGGLYWRNGSKYGVMAGLGVGFAMWAYTLLFPTILHNLPAQYSFTWVEIFLHQGAFGLSWLHPEALFGFSSLSPLTHGVLWSLGLNIITYIWVSKLFRPSIAEQIQAESFFYYEPKPILQQSHDEQDSKQPNHQELQSAIRLKVGDLFALAQRITGYESTQHAFDAFCQHNNLTFDANSTANGMWWRFTEQYLASAIGASSARTLLTTAMLNDGLAVGQVANILDQASRWQRFNRNLLMTMLDNMTLGVSVVDENMCLIAWNQHYLQLFDYPKGLVYIGCPIADLIRYNAERGECGEGSIEEHISKRLNWMRIGNTHEFERVRKNGQVIQMRGVPIDGGGFVTTFADITAFREQENILEAKVQERTQQLEIALAEQQLAREQADIANMAKSRFIAAASHDLLQPMHAARLFSTALEQSVQNPEDKQTVEQLDRALHGAESMLSALLDIARLESGTLQPKRQAYALHDLLSDLKSQFSGIAQQRQLKLHVHDTPFWIDTDPQWIRRIVQNFVSNALRYTAQGRIIVGVLRSATQANHIRIGVWDTGFGISEQQQQKLFQEFERGGHTSPWGEQGLGLGLAIVYRMTRLLQHQLTVHSKVNHGSCFMIEVPLTQTPTHDLPKTPQNITHGQQFNILCLDNDETILQGMRTLLGKWGHQIYATTNSEQAIEIIQHNQPDVWLIDQHLNHDKMGIDFILQHRIDNIPIALVTADSDPDLPQRLKELGIVLMKKPLKPAQLRAWLNSLKIKK